MAALAQAAPDNADNSLAAAEVHGGETVGPTRRERARSSTDLGAVDACLAAAAYSLKLDIAELWTFKREPFVSGVAAAGSAPTPWDLKPVCEHVYAQPAALETYAGRIAGIWNTNLSKGRDQQHIMSPGLCQRARESGCPVWFTSQDEEHPLHTGLPLNTAVAIPLEENTPESISIVIFFSTSVVKRDRLALEFLEQVSHAAVLLYRRTRQQKEKPAEGGSQEVLHKEVRGQLNKVSVILHSAEQLNTNVKWEELCQMEFLVNGSRCTIYTATYKGRSVVVKLLRKDVPDSESVREELELELELLMRVRHKNIVQLIGAGTDPERFLIIERLDGGTVAQRCGQVPDVRDRRRRFKQAQPFPYVQLLRYGHQVAEALRFLHEEAIPGKMVVHRDIKPDNIGFDKDGVVKLLDLGLSKLVYKSELDNTVYEMTGVTGSMRYMAPEVAECRPYSEKVDVYSYGMVLWEMATMRKPFDSMGRDEFYAQVVRGTARPPINKKWPKDFAQLMQDCWDVDWRKRPTASHVCDRLEEMLQEAMSNGSIDITGDGTGSTGPKKDATHAHPRRTGLLARLGISDRHTSWF